MSTVSHKWNIKTHNNDSTNFYNTLHFCNEEEYGVSVSLILHYLKDIEKLNGCNLTEY